MTWCVPARAGTTSPRAGERPDQWRPRQGLPDLHLLRRLDPDQDAQEAFGAGHDALAAVETIEGTAQADVMRGSQGDDDLRGGGGEDRIYGLGGADIIFIYGWRSPTADRASTSSRPAGALPRRWSRQRPDRSRQGSGHRLGGPAGDQFKVIDWASPVRRRSRRRQPARLRSHRRPVTVNIGKGRASWTGGRLRLAQHRQHAGHRLRDTRSADREATT